jgi:hypothetical protein
MFNPEMCSVDGVTVPICTQVIKERKVTYTKKQVGAVEGGKLALVLCGYEPFGDLQSLQYRLDAVRAQLRRVTENITELVAIYDCDDANVRFWRHEATVLTYAVEQGELLFSNSR